MTSITIPMDSVQSIDVDPGSGSSSACITLIDGGDPKRRHCAIYIDNTMTVIIREGDNGGEVLIEL